MNKRRSKIEWKEFSRLALACAAVLALACAPAIAKPSPSPTPGQASLTLTNCDADYCYTHDNAWTINKEVKETAVTNGVGTVTWTVTATKDSSAAPTFTVHGGLTIQNTGSASATIGNIVINLQKPNSPKKGSNASYVSIGADVADATNGDDATSAHIVAAGSQENAATNAAWATNNYTVSGAQGTFVETSCSGALEFTDASNNTLFSLNPQPVIPVGNSITLLYAAEFNVACLPAAGTVMRAEALVTFGNAGARGGSGSTAQSIDINGDSCVDDSSHLCPPDDNDEANVRTVPCRDTLDALPAVPEETNSSVTVTDPDTNVTATGTVTASNPAGFDQFPATVSDTTSWDVSVGVDSGTDGGSVCNKAELDGAGASCSLTVIIGYEEDGTTPIYAPCECAAPADRESSACEDISPPQSTCDPATECCPEVEFCDGDFCSFSQGGYGGSGAPYNRLAANFATLYPTGVESGIPGAAGFSNIFTSAAAVQDYLPAGGGANKLTGDSTDPTSTASGQFGGQALALELSIKLSDAGVNPAGFGDLYYCDASSSLNGQTVRQIVAVAETALGGGALPSGYSYATIAGLCANLNLSFDTKIVGDPNSACGVASAWAVTNLSKTPCP